MMLKFQNNHTAVYGQHYEKTDIFQLLML